MSEVTADPETDIRNRALQYVADHHTVSLATQGPDGLWAATVFYANIEFALYFLSEPKTRHAQNIATRTAVAATINEDYSDWREIKGIQMEASCQEVHGVRETGRESAIDRGKEPLLERLNTLLSDEPDRPSQCPLRANTSFSVAESHRFTVRSRLTEASLLLPSPLPRRRPPHLPATPIAPRPAFQVITRAGVIHEELTDPGQSDRHRPRRRATW